MIVERGGGIVVAKSAKESVRKMTSNLPKIRSCLKIEDCTRALGKMRETIKEMHALATSLTGLET